MGATRLWVRIELRRRWRRHVALTLILGLVGAFSLTCLAGARRTASAYDRFANAQGLPDLELAAPADHATMQALGTLPGAVAAGSYVPFFAAPTGHHLLPGQDFQVFSASDGTYNRTVDRPLLTSGRMPAADRADEVLVATSTARKLGLHLGDALTLDSLTPAQYDEISKGAPTENITFEGPRPVVHVVGIGRTRLDVGVNYAPAYLLATPAFYQRYIATMANYGELTDVRLATGTTAGRYSAEAQKRAGGEQSSLYVGRPKKVFQAIRDSAGVQGVALTLVALVAALAGAVLISQAVGRQLADGAADRRTLGVLGLDRRGSVGMAVAAFTPAVAVGAAVAIAAAWLASSHFPTGETGTFEVRPGTQLDAAVVLTGAAVLALFVLGRVALAARRISVAGARVSSSTRTSVVDRLVRALPAPEATGLRWALPGAREGARGPARTALVSVVIGAAGLSAALSYGHSLDHLVTTPAAYGWPFDADAGGGDDPSAVAGLRHTMQDDKAIGDLATVHIVSNVEVNGRSMQGFAFQPIRGVFSVTVVEGRSPVGPDEVLLGTRSAKDLHVGLGSEVTAPTPKGTTSLRVVGLGVFPNIDTDQFTTGALVIPATLATFDNQSGYDNVVFRWAPGTDVSKSVARLRSALLLQTLATAPPDLASLALVRSYPALLGAFVAVLALLAVANVLVVSIRRRRRQTGVLRAMGFTRRQVVRAVVSQGMALVAVGLAVGVPLGVALGRTAWRLHADRLGVAVVERVPLVTLALLGGLGFVVAAALALVVGTAVTRSAPADVLRGE